MTKLKIKINSPAPSLQTIRSYRDFGGLLHRYRKYYSTPGIRYMLYHERKKLVYIVIIILFLLLLLFVDDISQTPDQHQAQPVEAPVATPVR